MGLHILAGTVGSLVVLGTLLSAVRTVVVPRPESVRLTRSVFAVLRWVFNALARLREGYAWTDRVMARYAPIALLTLPLVWLGGMFVGFTLLMWSVGERPFVRALDVSGSSLLTLGFTKPDTAAGVALAFIGAGLTIAIVVLLLVTYLPSMYAAFAERERFVSLLESRAGSPPSGVEFVERLARIRGLDRLTPIWQAWEDWFARVQESHTTQPALVFFRSQQPDHSWITAAGALLDAASLYVACVEHGVAGTEDATFDVVGLHGRRSQQVRQPDAELCIRAGYLCLRHVAAFYHIPFDPDPAPDDPVAVTREEFDEAWERFDDAGVPLVEDRNDAWRAFAGWRVNYDTVLLELANLVAAPEAPWVSDRSPVLRL